MIEPAQPLRVIVCGTTFGRIYLSGIARLAEDFKLVGILARGSGNAKACAQKYNVPLYTNVNQLPQDEIDVACVVVRSAVVGGQGTKLATDLLDRGIHVVQEHPVHHDELVTCLKSARKSNCHYHLNSFYPDIATVRKFILTARAALQKSEAIHIDAACSIIVLFPLLDILGQSLGGVKPWSFQADLNLSGSRPLTLISGYIRGVPLTLRVQNQMDPKDPDNSALYLHRIELCTRNGSLILTDTHGLVLWNPRMHAPLKKDGAHDLFGTHSNLEFLVTEFVQEVEARPFKSVFNQLWPESIKRTLKRVRQSIVSGKSDKHLNQYQLTLCKVWQELGGQLGLPEMISTGDIRPLCLDEIRGSTQVIEDGSYGTWSDG